MWEYHTIKRNKDLICLSNEILKDWKKKYYATGRMPHIEQELFTPSEQLNSLLI
jgi:hypothetical protein